MHILHHHPWLQSDQSKCDNLFSIFFYFFSMTIFRLKGKVLGWFSKLYSQGHIKLPALVLPPSLWLVQSCLSTMAQWSICNAGGSTVCPLFHMSLPNTFPFILALSICHWGLPHGVDRVSQWWSTFSCSLVALSYSTPFYRLLQEKRCLTFFFFFAAARMHLHLSVFACTSQRWCRFLPDRA